MRWVPRGSPEQRVGAGLRMEGTSPLTDLCFWHADILFYWTTCHHSFFVLMFSAFCWGKKNCQLYSLIKYSPPKQCCCSFFLTVVSVIDFMNTFAQVYSFCPTAKRQHADRKKLQKKKIITDAMKSDKLNFWCILDLTFSCVIKVKFS